MKRVPVRPRYAGVPAGGLPMSNPFPSEILKEAKSRDHGYRLRENDVLVSEG